jgi:hypothetical protein
MVGSGPRTEQDAAIGLCDNTGQFSRRRTGRDRADFQRPFRLLAAAGEPPADIAFDAYANPFIPASRTCRDPNDVALDLLPCYNCDMTPAITDQMRQALDAEHGQPVKIVDEKTSQVYYVISAAQFEAMRALFAEGEFEPREAYPLIAKTAAEAGWADHVMDAYDNYDEHRQ